MRTAFAIPVIGFCLACCGCALVEDTSRNFVVGMCRSTEEMREHCRNKRWAEETWRQVAARGAYSSDYAHGFKAGFADYLFGGGDGEPPVMAPPRYRTMGYQSAAGRQAIEDWFAGFRHGAAEAQASGRRQWIVGPSSLDPRGGPAPEEVEPLARGTTPPGLMNLKAQPLAARSAVRPDAPAPATSPSPALATPLLSVSGASAGGAVTTGVLTAPAARLAQPDTMPAEWGTGAWGLDTAPKTPPSVTPAHLVVPETPTAERAVGAWGLAEPVSDAPRVPPVAVERRQRLPIGPALLALPETPAAHLPAVAPADPTTTNPIPKSAGLAMPTTTPEIAPAISPWAPPRTPAHGTWGIDDWTAPRIPASTKTPAEAGSSTWGIGDRTAPRIPSTKKSAEPMSSTWGIDGSAATAPRITLPAPRSAGAGAIEVKESSLPSGAALGAPAAGVGGPRLLPPATRPGLGQPD
ncbi:MAG: hypothetical protein U0793_27255 [Gemmataceae bacterium]